MATIELFGNARVLAGTASVEVSAATIRTALLELAALHHGLVGTVLTTDGSPTPAYTLNLEGVRFVRDLDEPLAANDHLLLISSLSGG
jgi:molybdopterin converting factor small subunit